LAVASALGAARFDAGPLLLLRPPLRAAPADPRTGALVELAGAAAEAEFAAGDREIDGCGIVLRSAEARGSSTWQVTCPHEWNQCLSPG